MPGADQAVLLYAAARRQGRRPLLLESLGPRAPFSRRTLLALDPVRTLELRDGRLCEDGCEAKGLEAGEEAARGLLARLEPPCPGRFFPLWAGFLAYEFAGRLGLPTQAPMPGLPEASFSLYQSGYLWEDGRLVCEPPVPVEPLPTGDADPTAAPLPAIDLRSDYPHDGFIAGVEEVQERIRGGWVYQVNLSHRFSFAADSLDPLAFYARLRLTNPSPFMGIVEGEGWAIVSGSPERLFDRRDGVVSARPIAGTRRRGRDASEEALFERELRTDAKEQAEHVMLVDLLRNDLSRVCAPGTVEVSEAFTVERYSHVMHLVSEVRGRSRAHLPALVAAIFPGGTITGAPKESVMREIARLEPVPRGAYTGSLGYVAGTGEADFNILIRSLTVAEGTGHISAGGGIVIGSDPRREYSETRHKAEALLHVLGEGVRGLRPRPPVRDRAWRPARPRSRRPCRVLFVECHDSFSHTIVDYLRVSGASVDVVDHAERPRSTVSTRRSDSHPSLLSHTHVVLGPGPGDPASSGALLAWVAAALAEGVPLLGICLGHQALGVALGARLARAPRPVHGEAHAVRHEGSGLFRGMPSPLPFTRYHSLRLTDLPAELAVTATTEDDVVMAVSHVTLPAHGVQFHPESMLSLSGLELLDRFLEIPRAG